MLALARLDDRLIHGQVVVGWVRYVKADCIVVANDAIAADPMQCALLPMAVPPEIQVEIFKVEEAAARLQSGAFDEKQVILLFSSPADVLRYLACGGKLETLNVGGMRFVPGKTQILNAVSVSDLDVEAFLALAQRHLALRVQMVPGDSPQDLLRFLPQGRA
jgi:PTS system mannose-specific IIB component